MNNIQIWWCSNRETSVALVTESSEYVWFRDPNELVCYVLLVIYDQNINLVVFNYCSFQCQVKYKCTPCYHNLNVHSNNPKRPENLVFGKRDRMMRGDIKASNPELKYKSIFLKHYLKTLHKFDIFKLRLGASINHCVCLSVIPN